MNWKARAKKLKRQVPAVFLAMKDPQTPRVAKLLGAVTVGYALSPVDLIPDFIPVLGYLDDLLILPLLVALTVRWIPDVIWQRSLQKAEGLWENGKPKKWYYAIPVLLFWILIIVMILNHI